MPKLPIDYSKTVIYKIQHIDNEELLYVGHSTNFAERKKKHNNSVNTSQFKVYKMIRENGGWDNFSCVIVHNFPCSSFEEARTEEDRVMREMKSNMNTYRAFTSPEEKKEQQKECYKNYYNENKKELSQKHKQYYNEHKDEITQYRKEYNNNHKDEIAIQKKEKFKCSCGGKYRRDGKSQHEKTKKHIAFMDSLPSVC